MEIRDASVLRLVNERWGANVVPHLAGDHGEGEQECQQSPKLFVLQELQIVALQVQKPADEGDQHDDCDSSGVVWRTENADLRVGSLLHPLGNGLGGNADSLNVHGVAVLGLALRWEVHEDRRGVEAKHLENVAAFVEVNHGEEELVRVRRRVAVRVGQDGVLVGGWPANHALPRWLKSREHDNHRVVSGRRLHVLLELVAVEAEDRLFGVPVEELLHLLGQRSSALESNFRLNPKATSSIFIYSLFALAIGVSGEGDECDERQQDAIP